MKAEAVDVGAKVLFEVRISGHGALYRQSADGGSTCEDPPGVRSRPAGQLYLACLRDPDGHKLCGLFRMPKG